MPKLFFQKHCLSPVDRIEIESELHAYALAETGTRGRNPFVKHEYVGGEHVYDCWIEVDEIPERSPVLEGLEEEGGPYVTARMITISDF